MYGNYKLGIVAEMKKNPFLKTGISGLHFPVGNRLLG